MKGRYMKYLFAGGLLAVAATTLLCGGCRTPPPAPLMTDKAYIVHAVIAEVAEADLQRMDLVWTLDGSRRVTMMEAETLLRTLFSSRRAHVVEFPLLPLNAEEQDRVDLRQPFSFIGSYDVDGEPVKHTLPAVGTLIEVSLEAVKDDVAPLTFTLEHVAISSWMDVEMGEHARPLSFPVLDVQNASTSVELTVNHYLVSGGMLRTREGVTYNTIICVGVLHARGPDGAPAALVTSDRRGRRQGAR